MAASRTGGTQQIKILNYCLQCGNHDKQMPPVCNGNNNPVRSC